MVVLGRVGAAFGVRGWVRIQPYADEPLAWCQMPRWWIGREADDPGWRTVELAGCREHGRSLLARFDGVDDRSSAEALQGMLVAAPRDALPATQEDEYYWADLIGLDVVGRQGDRLGKVVELISTGAHEVLRVLSEAGTERLLPFVEQVVLEVDLANRVVRVDWEADW
jgi:16S rRNA processing protein RimM